MKELLEGIKIVNSAYNLPGPIAAFELSKFGAAVIKVEPPGGDRFGQFCREWYSQLVAGNEILQLDLKSADGLEALHALLVDADIFITSIRPSALERLGLDWATLQDSFPRLGHVEIIGYPHPYEEKPGHDLTYQAEAGLVSPPELPRSLYSDLFGAQRAVQAALLLLLKQKNTGCGGSFRISLAEVVGELSSPMEFHLTRAGELLGGGLPHYNLYETRDGWIALAALEDKFWNSLISVLDLSGKQITKEVLEAVFILEKTDHWLTLAEEYDLPISEVK